MQAARQTVGNPAIDPWGWYSTHYKWCPTVIQSYWDSKVTGLSAVTGCWPWCHWREVDDIHTRSPMPPSGVRRKITFHASPAARPSTCLVSASPVAILLLFTTCIVLMCSAPPSEHRGHNSQVSLKPQMCPAPPSEEISSKVDHCTCDLYHPRRTYSPKDETNWNIHLASP